MDKQTFRTMMNNPFGSKAWDKLDKSDRYTQTYTHDTSIEDLAKKLFSSTGRIDELYLINKQKDIFAKSFYYITEEAFRDYDIEVQAENRKT